MKSNQRNIAVAAVAALVAFATVDTRPSGLTTVVDSNYETSGEHAKAVAYQVYRDFNQCLRTIPNSTLWNSAAYDIEYLTCCTELALGNDLATDINYGFDTSVRSFYDAACGDDEEAAVAPPDVRRTARVDALMARPERFDLADFLAGLPSFGR